MKLSDYVVLPAEITEFERSYLHRSNRIASAFFAAHVPFFALVAWINDTRPALAALLAFAVLLGPLAAHAVLPNPRHVSVVHGVAAMFMGGLLVHFGQGPMQIEMHFYFFALLAMTVVFANPAVIVASAATVALHHLVVWVVLPRSVFNYDASVWVVAVHAAFVVLESVAACFIARSFFDKVIGLERIVRARTEALDARNRDMRLLLDSMQEGFLTIDRRGVPAPERSAAVDRFLGAPEGETFFDWLARSSPDFAERSRLAWAEVVDDVMPLVVTLDQMPRHLAVPGGHLRVEYRPVGGAEPCERFLVVVTDATAELARDESETAKRELSAVLDHVLDDRAAFETFFEEASSAVQALVRGDEDLATQKRVLHTLKGNAALYGLASVATLCHRLEDDVAEHGRAPSAAELAPLLARWEAFAKDAEKLVARRAGTIEIDERQHAALVDALRRGDGAAQVLRMVQGFKLEPASKRLGLFAEQASRIARRLDKGDLTVTVEDNGVRLDHRRWSPFWSSLLHVVRNALDHGIESVEARRAAGKPEHGSLALRTRHDGDRVVVEVQDDGAGVDWEEVARRARSAGLAASTPDDLVRALLGGGISTAATVSELSGRGIGMTAVAQATRALGGNLSIETARGRGTTVRMTFPALATGSMPAAMRAA